MKVIPLNQVKVGMHLEQNIYRHDSLLALPKGIMIGVHELEQLKHYSVDFVSVFEDYREHGLGTIENILHIIEEAYNENTLLEKTSGEKIFQFITSEISKNKKIQPLLNEWIHNDYLSFVQSVNTSIILASLLLNEHEVPNKEISHLSYLALLHDIGRAKLIIHRDSHGNLDDKEFKKLHSLPQTSFQILKHVGFSDEEIGFVDEVYEHFDGTGFPNRIKGKELDDIAQIISISKNYNQLVEFNSKNQMITPCQAVDEIHQQSNFQFGEKCVKFFSERFTPYQIGSSVELSDGRVAIVKSLHPHHRILPTVEVIDDFTGETTAIIIDLQFHRDTKIVRVLSSY